MRLSSAFGAAACLAALLSPPGSGYGQSQGGQQAQPQQGNANANPQSGQQAQFQQGNANANQQPGQQAPSSGQNQSTQQGQPGQGRWFVADPNNARLVEEVFRNAAGYWNANNPNQQNAVWTFRHADDGNSGMRLASADDALRAQLKLPKDQGLIVTAVQPGSSAALAGIRANDVLLQLENDRSQSVSLGKPEDLNWLKAGNERPMNLVLLRHGQRVTLKVQPRITVSLGPVRPEPPSYWIGVSVGMVEPALRSQLQLQEGQGLLVINIVKDSPAAAAGIQANDILLKLDGEPLTDQARLIQLVQARQTKPVQLEILRAGKPQAITITPQPRRTSWAEPKPSVLSFVYPGAVGTGQHQRYRDLGLGNLADIDNDGNLDLFVTGTASIPKKAQDGDKATSRRLDELSAQIKELRQAIDALTQAAKEKK